MNQCNSAIICDDDKMRYVGWDYQLDYNTSYQYFFSPNTVRMISNKITQLLQGVDSKGRSIMVPDDKICHVMSQVYDSHSPKIGDIHTRFVIPDKEPRDDVQTMINRTIEIIVNDVKVNLGMIECNSKLSIWDATLLGDFNRQGLRQYPPIKLREKRPMSCGAAVPR